MAWYTWHVVHIGCEWKHIFILPIYHILFSPYNLRMKNTQGSHVWARYNCFSWVSSLTKVLHLNLLCCVQYRVILYHDISWVYNMYWHWYIRKNQQHEPWFILVLKFNLRLLSVALNIKSLDNFMERTAYRWMICGYVLWLPGWVCCGRRNIFVLHYISLVGLVKQKRCINSNRQWRVAS